MVILILTLIVVILFVIFGVTIYKEFSKMSKKMTSNEREIVYQIMNRTIADMESEGVYFSEEIKEELKKQREELICHYSGLPSVQSWENYK
jgi:predicted Holliday junction resolvase-like endonuclease